MKMDIASKSDIGEILDLQKGAYVNQAHIFNDFSIPPLTESIDEIDRTFDDQIFLKIENDGTLLGSVRAIETKTVCHIGRLIVNARPKTVNFPNFFVELKF